MNEFIRREGILELLSLFFSFYWKITTLVWVIVCLTIQSCPFGSVFHRAVDYWSNKMSGYNYSLVVMEKAKPFFTTGGRILIFLIQLQIPLEKGLRTELISANVRVPSNDASSCSIEKRDWLKWIQFGICHQNYTHPIDITQKLNLHYCNPKQKMFYFVEYHHPGDNGNYSPELSHPYERGTNYPFWVITAWLANNYVEVHWQKLKINLISKSFEL